MNQTKFHIVMNVNEVRRLTSSSVHVEASLGEDKVSFKMYTSETDTPKVNDDILVTITTPAPETIL